jgi:hypothetical protein
MTFSSPHWFVFSCNSQTKSTSTMRTLLIASFAFCERLRMNIGLLVGYHTERDGVIAVKPRRKGEITVRTSTENYRCPLKWCGCWQQFTGAKKHYGPIENDGSKSFAQDQFCYFVEEAASSSSTLAIIESHSVRIFPRIPLAVVIVRFVVRLLNWGERGRLRWRVVNAVVCLP